MESVRITVNRMRKLSMMQQVCSREIKFSRCDVACCRSGSQSRLLQRDKHLYFNRIMDLSFSIVVSLSSVAIFHYNVLCTWTVVKSVHHSWTLCNIRVLAHADKSQEFAACEKTVLRLSYVIPLQRPYDRFVAIIIVNFFMMRRVDYCYLFYYNMNWIVVIVAQSSHCYVAYSRITSSLYANAATSMGINRKSRNKRTIDCTCETVISNYILLLLFVDRKRTHNWHGIDRTNVDA